MDKNEQFEFAISLLDFCERDLSTENTAKFFKLHAPHLLKEQRNAVILTALSLL